MSKSPKVLVLYPDQLCIKEGWRGTTNVIHVLLLMPQKSIENVISKFPKIDTEWGISIQSPYSPPIILNENSIFEITSPFQAYVFSNQNILIDQYVLYENTPHQNLNSTLENSIAPMKMIDDGVFCSTFYLRPKTVNLKKINLKTKILISGLVIGEIEIEIPLGNLGGQKAFTEIKDTYQNIFACYAREDLPIVEHIDSIIRNFNFGELWWDLKFLKAGNKWKDQIKKVILEVDKFQLFWSKSAKKSYEVKKEWMFALENREQNFIQPIYWEEPMINAPKKLSNLHFAKINFPKI